MADNQKDRVNLLRKIDQCIRTSGFDENFVLACQFHLGKVLLQRDPSKITSKEEYINILMSNLFIEKIDLFPAKRFQSQVNECTAWPVPLLPSEVFAGDKIPVDTRKFVFYQCLQVGDYLECRVMPSHPSSAEYQLRVVHKYGVTRMLDDLNIIVTMRKADISDLPQVLKEFGNRDLVRVVATEKEEKDNEIQVYVSVKDNKTDLRSFRPLLGKIPDTHVPKYVLNPYHSDKPSFKDYLTSSQGFYHPVVLNGIYEGFGINPRGTYTYFPIDESLSSMDINAMFKESKLNDAKEYMEIAIRYETKGDFAFALMAINLAIESYPVSPVASKKDKVELSKLYETRGNINSSEKASEKKPKISHLGCIDWLKAVNYDRTNNSVKVSLSKAISHVAMKYYRKKMYNSAAENASKALKLDENNVAAQSLMEHLKIKYPAAAAIPDAWEEASIQDLLEKHKAIGSELIKLSGEVNVPIVPYSLDTSPSPSPSPSAV